jgi:hypothetical protein
MEPKIPLPCSQEPATGPCSEPDECSLQPRTQIALRSILIFSHLCLGLPNSLLPSDFPTEILYVFLTSSPFVLHARPIPSLICSPENISSKWVTVLVCTMSLVARYFPHPVNNLAAYGGVSKSFRTGRPQRELQMV